MATDTRNPTSDEAVSGTWSGSVGSRYTLVDDYPSTATNDLLTGGTAAAVITFGFSAFAIPAGATGISVQVLYYDGEAANGANNCGARIKVGGTYYNAATHNPAGTAGTSRSDNWATNPKTGAAWTVDDVNGVGANALQAFGMNSTDSNPTWRFSSIQLQVTYTPIAARTGSGSGTVSAATGSGSGAVSVAGTGSAGVSSATGSGVGNVDVSGSGAGTVSAATGSGSGTVSDPAPAERTGSGAGIVSAATGSGTGAVVASGSGSSTVSKATSSGAGAVVATGSGGANVSAATGSGAGDVDVSGSGSGTVSAATGAGTGTVEALPGDDSITGIGAGTVSAATGVGAGSVVVSGSGAGTVSSATGSGTGTNDAVVQQQSDPKPRRHSRAPQSGYRRVARFGGPRRIRR